MKKVFFLILFSIIFVLILIVVVLMRITAPTITVEKIYFPASKEFIFIKNKSKGLNYSVTVVSKSSKKYFEPNGEIEYVYKAEPTLFYEVKKDSLIIYCGIKAKTPSEFNSNISVVQQQISNIEFSELKKNYQQRGINYFVPKYYN